jgi:hypothetical protein
MNAMAESRSLIAEMERLLSDQMDRLVRLRGMVRAATGPPVSSFAA